MLSLFSVRLSAQLPNITGSILRSESTQYQDVWDYSDQTGAFSGVMSNPNTDPYGGLHYSNANDLGYTTPFKGVSFNASYSNSIYATGGTVRPKSIKTKFYIKY